MATEHTKYFMYVHEFVPVHAMKACGANTGTDPLILNRRCLETSGKLHAPVTLLQGKESSLSNIYIYIYIYSLTRYTM